MVIEYPQRKVKDVIVTNRAAIGMGTPVWAPVLEVIYDEGHTNPFRRYYEVDSQKGHMPHHAFAKISEEKDLAPFFGSFGFPSNQDRELVVSKVLLEAKRLRLLMEAWSAFLGGKLAAARKLLGELDFARHPKSHFVYWPLRLRHGTDGGREAVRNRLKSLEDERQRFVEAASRHRTKSEIHQALVDSTRSVCAGPLRLVELTPKFYRTQRAAGRRGPKAQGIELRWSLRAAQLPSEKKEDRGTRVQGGPYVAAPYYLMFLLDLTIGSETRVCSDRSCRAMFRVKRRDQIYCSYACAHRTAVRRDRGRKSSNIRGAG